MRLYTDNALTIPDRGPTGSGSVGDIGWDPISKKLYFINSFAPRTLRYLFPYDMRWNTEGLACQTFIQGNIDVAQLTFTTSGKNFYGQTVRDIYSINRVPPTATATFIGTLPPDNNGPYDLTDWPCTYPV